jgi:hypothetical protein
MIWVNDPNHSPTERVISPDEIMSEIAEAAAGCVMPEMTVHERA